MKKIINGICIYARNEQGKQGAQAKCATGAVDAKSATHANKFVCVVAAVVVKSGQRK